MLNTKRAAMKLVKTASVLMTGALLLSAAPPKGWYMAGDHPQNYESGVDAQTVYGGRPSAYLKYTGSTPEGFGTLMQDFKADQYQGKRIRFSAEVKSDGVQDWAGLWMRVDKAGKMASFDNMQDRAIKGTTDWRHCEIVLDVPQDATGIFFGILLSKTGKVWMSGANVEVVDSAVPVTKESVSPKSSPANLGFEN